MSHLVSTPHRHNCIRRAIFRRRTLFISEQGSPDRTSDDERSTVMVELVQARFIASRSVPTMTWSDQIPVPVAFTDQIEMTRGYTWAHNLQTTEVESSKAGSRRWENELLQSSAHGEFDMKRVTKIKSLFIYMVCQSSVRSDMR